MVAGVASWELTLSGANIKQREKLGTKGDFELSKLTPSSSIFSSARPHLQIFPEQCHQLGTKGSNIWDHGDIYHSNHYMFHVAFDYGILLTTESKLGQYMSCDTSGHYRGLASSLAYSLPHERFFLLECCYVKQCLFGSWAADPQREKQNKTITYHWLRATLWGMASVQW